MNETLYGALAALVIAFLCAVFSRVLRAKKQKLLSLVTTLVQQAEQTVEGSKMGAAKKALVVAQLQALGIKATDKLGTLIDNTVAYLNAKSGWLKTIDNTAAADTAAESEE